MRAVVDRIVDGRVAVLLVGAAEEERVVPVDQLPLGASEGSWLKVSLIGPDLLRAELDQTATDAVKKRISRKLDALRRRGRGLGRKT